MSTGSEDSPLVSFSVRAYRLLIGAYPAAFRQKYGEHMLQLFRDCSRRQHRQKGASGMLTLWAVTLFDFARSVVAEHLQRETIMNRQLFIRLSGWALVSGGVLFSWAVVASFLDEMRFYPIRGLNGFYDTSVLAGIFVLGPPLIGVGMIGLLVRFGNAVGMLGKAALLIGAIAGGLATSLAFLSEVVTSGDEYFILIVIGGLTLMFICLAFFGILALRRRVMPRWNGLPIVAGLWFPVMLGLTDAGNRGGDILEYATLVTALIFAVLMVLLGFTLQAVDRDEPAIV
ncbi:MAG: hypothetical protein R3293_28295 [Candidatus Promineifilaceae bacterium]|nr:hypothetical protein [Candidatus Promineifilaceae bacterium]